MDDNERIGSVWTPSITLDRTPDGRRVYVVGGRRYAEVPLGPEDAYRFLAEQNINAPAGSFYALEASRRLGLGDTGGLRIGIAPYTDDAEIDRLNAALTEFVTGR